jgi:hypothetical protein
MESTKVVSLRLAMGTYETIILECDAKGITITEWFDRQIAMGKKAKAAKYELIDKLEQVCEFTSDLPSLVKYRLNRVIRFVKVEL